MGSCIVLTHFSEIIAPCKVKMEMGPHFGGGKMTFVQ